MKVMQARRHKGTKAPTAQHAPSCLRAFVPPCLGARRGFTFIELCLGLVVTSLVMAALAAFSLSMSTAWSCAGQTQALTLRGNQAVAWIQKEVRNARLLGAVRAGSINGSGTSGAAVVMWKADTNGDGFIQGAEVEMIEHDLVNHTLKIYSAGQGDAAAKWQWTVFTDPAVCDQFKVGRSAQIVAKDVYGASFATSGTGSASQSPSFQYALKIVANETSSAALGDSGVVGADSRMMVQYGAATVRAPAAQPSY